MEYRYLTAAETAKLVRAALKTAYPTIKFSVKSKTYAGGASIGITWIDGPTTKEVDAIVQPFGGADFDGMQDLKTYNKHLLNGEPVRFGADFIFTYRKPSPALRAEALEIVKGWNPGRLPEYLTIEKVESLPCGAFGWDLMAFADAPTCDIATAIHRASCEISKTTRAALPQLPQLIGNN